MMLCILLLPFFGLHGLFHLELLGHVNTPLHGRPRCNGVHPLLDVGKRLGFDARPFRPVDPAEAAEVRDGVFVADQVRLGRAVFLTLRGQAIVQDFIQALGLGLVAIDTVLDLLGSV